MNYGSYSYSPLTGRRREALRFPALQSFNPKALKNESTMKPPRRKKAKMKDRVIRKAEECLANYAERPFGLYDEYKNLLADYEKLLQRFNKVIVISDKYQEQLRDLTDKLNATVDHLNQLQEITLPMCLFCKKIRTDTDYWQQVESYFKEHIDIMFSHGICPDCMKEQYGELLAEHDP